LIPNYPEFYILNMFAASLGRIPIPTKPVTMLVLVIFLGLAHETYASGRRGRTRTVRSRSVEGSASVRTDRSPHKRRYIKELRQIVTKLNDLPRAAPKLTKANKNMGPAKKAKKSRVKTESDDFKHRAKMSKVLSELLLRKLSKLNKKLVATGVKAFAEPELAVLKEFVRIAEQRLKLTPEDRKVREPIVAGVQIVFKLKEEGFRIPKVLMRELLTLKSSLTHSLMRKILVDGRLTTYDPNLHSKLPAIHANYLDQA